VRDPPLTEKPAKNLPTIALCNNLLKASITITKALEIGDPLGAIHVCFGKNHKDYHSLRQRNERLTNRRKSDTSIFQKIHTYTIGI
jgi:hypothetical protein